MSITGVFAFQPQFIFAAGATVQATTLSEVLDRAGGMLGDLYVACECGETGDARLIRIISQKLLELKGRDVAVGSGEEDLLRRFTDWLDDFGRLFQSFACGNINAGEFKGLVEKSLADFQELVPTFNAEGFIEGEHDDGIPITEDTAFEYGQGPAERLAAIVDGGGGPVNATDRPLGDATPQTMGVIDWASRQGGYRGLIGGTTSLAGDILKELKRLSSKGILEVMVAITDEQVIGFSAIIQALVSRNEELKRLLREGRTIVVRSTSGVAKEIRSTEGRITSQTLRPV